jgi:hypothetical protein
MSDHRPFTDPKASRFIGSRGPSEPAARLEGRVDSRSIDLL